MNAMGARAPQTCPSAARSAGTAACSTPPRCDACKAGRRLGVALGCFSFTALSELRPLLGEPDGDAFGFSFKRVTSARRINRAGAAIGCSDIRKPSSARGNHIKACVCVFGGRAQLGMMPGASCTRSCDL